MYANDRLGDCTCAAAAHLIQDWTSNNSGEVTLADPDILKAYEAVSGYDPDTHTNDNGAVETDVLNYWRHTGIGGRNIHAYVSLEPGTDHKIIPPNGHIQVTRDPVNVLDLIGRYIFGSVGGPEQTGSKADQGQQSKGGSAGQ